MMDGDGTVPVLELGNSHLIFSFRFAMLRIIIIVELFNTVFRFVFLKLKIVLHTPGTQLI